MKLNAFILATLLISGLTTSLPAKAQADDFAGEYIMKGRGDAKNDTNYSGSCTIKNETKGYDVSCLNTDTDHTYVGKGLAAGNTLALVIGDRLVGDHGQVFEGEYLVIYTRAENGTLVGRWVDAQSGHKGNETLTPKK